MSENFELAYPWLLSLLPLPFLVYWLLPPLRTRSTSIFFPMLHKLAEYTHLKPRVAALVKRRKWINTLLLSITWGLLVIALSSPQLTGEPELKVKTSRSFLIAADISNSMAEKDWELDGQKARRWDGVKALMKNFIAEREGDRMGLIFFGSAAYIQSPFTTDLKVVNELMDEADVGMAGQSTHIGKAIAKGMDLFEKDTLETKVILLLTDGVDAGDDVLPIDAANLAAKDSVVIHTLGIGTPGTGGQDLDEKTLQEISATTGGKYFLAEDQEKLKTVYDELDAIEPIEYEEEQNRPVTLLYMYPLGAAVVLMLLSYLLNLLFSLWQSQRTTKIAAS